MVKMLVSAIDAILDLILGPPNGGAGGACAAG